jgi:hypothetical protein
LGDRLEALISQNGFPAAMMQPTRAIDARWSREVPMPVLPASVTDACGFNWPPAKRSMSPDDGQNCPCFALRKVNGEKGSP